MKIHNKLFLILFSFSLILVTVLVLVIQWSIGKGMVEYVNNKEAEVLDPVITQLETEYKKYGDWSTLERNRKKFGDLLLLHLKDSVFMVSPPPIKPPPHLSHHRSPPEQQAGIYYALLDTNGQVVVGNYQKEFPYNKSIISVDQKEIGWLMIPKRKKIIDGYELAFIEQQQSYLWIISLVTMLFVGLLTAFLARHLAEPVKLVTKGMHKLTQGEYQQKIKLNREDELGELARDFNELAITLYKNETARKRWLANISHELRTPVSILRGELEAMLDDVRPINKVNIGSANDEVKHLQHLINDLQVLTSADIGGMHYRKEMLNINDWLRKESVKYQSYLAAENIKLTINISVKEVMIFADNIRLCQLFENLINNCIKYSEASEVKITSTLMGNSVQVIVEDNGVGVLTTHLAHLFEHLYRVDESRNRATGGAGLGLSICEHIVEAHQGSISAANSEMDGLAVIVKLPIT